LGREGWEPLGFLRSLLRTLQEGARKHAGKSARKFEGPPSASSLRSDATPSASGGRAKRREEGSCRQLWAGKVGNPSGSLGVCCANSRSDAKNTYGSVPYSLHSLRT